MVSIAMRVWLHHFGSDGIIKCVHVCAGTLKDNTPPPFVGEVGSLAESTATHSTVATAGTAADHQPSAACVHADRQGGKAGRPQHESAALWQLCVCGVRCDQVGGVIERGGALCCLLHRHSPNTELRGQGARVPANT